MLVDADAVETDALGIFELVEIIVIGLMSHFRIEEARRHVDPHRAVVRLEVLRQLRIGHQVEPVELHGVASPSVPYLWRHHGIIAGPGKAFRPKDFARSRVSPTGPAYYARAARRIRHGDHRIRAETESPPRRRARGDGAPQRRGRQIQHLAADAGERAVAAAVVPRDRPRCRRPARERPCRRQSDEGAAASLALERDIALSRPHRRDRQGGGRAADRIRRPAAIPSDQSRSRRPPAGDVDDPLRGLDLQSRRCRAGACSCAECQPHDPVGEGRLHDDRGRALRSPSAAILS